MTDLLSLQRNFAKHIFAKSNHDILKQVAHSNLEALARLNIYRNNVVGNFESILSSIFVVTKKILGEKKFEKLIEKYCQKFPSKSGDLNEFGKEFPQFLCSHKPLFLKDLAQLELFYHQSYFIAASGTKFDLKKFQKLSEENFSDLIFTLNLSCVLFSSKFAIFSIWQKEQKLRNCMKAELAMIRSDGIFLLNEEEFLFLSLILQKKKLDKIYETLCHKLKKEVNIGALINRFIANGTITEFKIKT